MKKLLLSMIVITTISFAEIPISNLPSFTGSQIGSIDTVPFVNFATNTTGQLPFSQFFLIPSLQNPTFTGTITVPTCVFAAVTVTQTLTVPTGTFTSSLSVPTGTFTSGINVQGVATLGNTPVQHNLNTVSAAFANCGSLAGATGCIKLKLNGTVRYIPFF